MRISRTLAGLTCISLCCPIALYPGARADLPDPAPRTVAVAVFKNGLAFVVRHGEVRLQSGTGRIAPIPNATLGTLWLSPDDPGASLDEAVSYRYTVGGERTIASLAEVLQANPGKTVTITYNMKEYTGEIVGLRDQDSLPPDPSVTPEVPRDAASSLAPARAQYLLLKVEKRLLAVPLASISQAALPDDTRFRETFEQQRQALRFKLKSATNKTNLTLGYLEHGLGWTPSYLISLTDDKTAQITMQAVVVDDAEDLKDADVFFVVGVPNFAYSNTASPMSLQQSLLDFMRDAGRRDGDRNLRYTNAIAGQLVMNAEERSFRGSEASFGNTVEELSGAPEEDLFLYTRAGVTLDRGERATYNVFSGNIPYEHIYEWEVQDQPRVDGFGNVIQPNSNPSTPDAAALNGIWHSVRLKNSTKVPWTSAPALVISGTKPVSQDTLPYTPKAASSNLKITVATDLRSSHEEREIARQQDVQRRRGYNYDLVTVEGTLKVKNYKTREVNLAIGKTLRGAVESQSDGGKAVKLGEAIEADNPMSRLTWEITLKPGEERTVSYRYKVWIRV
jgi:hypothetical protein